MRYLIYPTFITEYIREKKSIFLLKIIFNWLKSYFVNFIVINFSSYAFTSAVLKSMLEKIIFEKWHVFFKQANDSKRMTAMAAGPFESPSEKEVGFNKRVSNWCWASRGMPYKVNFESRPLLSVGSQTGRMRSGRAEAPLRCRI